MRFENFLVVVFMRRFWEFIDDNFLFQMKECCYLNTNINNFLKIEQKIPLQRHEIFREVLYYN